MKRIKQILVAATLCGMMSAAQAADRDLGALVEGYHDFGPHVVAASSFLDKIYFTLPQASSADFGGGALNYSVRGAPYRQISDLSLSLFNNASDRLGGGGDFSVNQLAPGAYYLQVAGAATGSAGGLYAGSISVTALPVPEPGIGSSLVAGLIMLGFMALRRRTQR